ncbi:MAG: LysR family transcriptional regulator [Butyrivibrio sp.]|nr:LysR family transcriptional regulator [Butyrivibrio sp.]
MTINNIRIFLEVYKYMSITEASKTLHMTQPVISRTIKNLEDEYNSRFFERIGKRLYPTEAGKLFYLRMSQIVNDIDTVRTDLLSEQDGQTIRIGAAIMIGNFLIPDICQEIYEKYPEVSLKVTIASAKELKNKLLANELDFALIEDSLHESDFKYSPFYNDSMIPVFSPDHDLAKKKSLSLKNLAEYPFLLREQGSGTRTYVDSLFSSKGLIIDTMWESSSTQAIIRGVERNLGISILPHKFVNDYIKKGLLATGKMSDKLPERTCFIVYHKDKYITELYKNIFEIINSVTA